jgi:hypothetical protein
MRFGKLFKREVEVRYVPSQPRYQALGYVEGHLYFINGDTGRVFKISRDRTTDYEVITNVLTIHDR